MADRILDKVARNFGYRFLGRQYHERLIFHVKREPDLRRRCHMGEGFRGLAYEPRGVQDKQAMIVAALEACEAQQLPDDASHTFALFMEQDDVFALLQPLKAGLHNGHRRPELMCGIGCKTALHFHGFDQALEPSIDGSDQRLNLGRRPINIKQPLVRTDLRSLLGNLSQGRQVAAKACGTNEKSGNADRRRSPGHVSEKVDELINSLIRVTFNAAEMHEQPCHLQSSPDRQHKRKPPSEPRHERIAVKHHLASFGTQRR
jgi:hypothetical protein